MWQATAVAQSPWPFAPCAAIAKQLGSVRCVHLLCAVWQGHRHLGNKSYCCTVSRHLPTCLAKAKQVTWLHGSLRTKASRRKAKVHLRESSQMRQQLTSLSKILKMRL